MKVLRSERSPEMSSQIATRTSSRKERNEMEVDGSGWAWMEATRETRQHPFAWFFRERPDDLRKTIEEPFNLSTFLGPSEKTISRFRTLINQHWELMKGEETDPAIIMCRLAGENLFLIQHVSNIASPQCTCLLVIFGFFLFPK